MQRDPRRALATRAVLIGLSATLILLAIAWLEPFRSRGDEPTTVSDGRRTIYLPIASRRGAASALQIEAEQSTLGNGWMDRWHSAASNCRYVASINPGSAFSLNAALPRSNQVYVWIRLWADRTDSQMVVAVNGSAQQTLRAPTPGWSWHRVVIPGTAVSAQNQIVFTAQNPEMGVDTVEVTANPSYAGGGIVNCGRAAPSASIFGIATKGEMTEQPQVIRNLHPSWLRTSLRWKDIEPNNTTPANYVWHSADNSVQRALGSGAMPMMMLWQNPAWAATTTCGPIDKTSLDEVGQFVGAVVERYDGDGVNDAPGSPVVTVYEFYNEPDWNNKSQDWLGGCWGQHAAEYANFMRVAWTAAHRANANVVVLNGSLASEDSGIDPSTSQPYFNFNLNGGDFFDQFLQAGGGNYIDGVNIHYYRAFYRRWMSWGEDIIGKTRYYQARLRPYGLDHLPFYASEIGMRSDSGQVIENVPGNLTRQRDYLPKVFVRALSANYRALTWYTASDDGNKHWGLINSVGEAKPSYRAFQTMVAELPGARWAGPYPLPSTVEGYRMKLADGSHIVVLWSRSTGVVGVPFQGRQARVVQVEGQNAVVNDGDAIDADHNLNGYVTVPVGESPVYVRILTP